MLPSQHPQARPIFLFIVGVAIPLAYTKRLAQGVSRSALVRKAVKRSAILFGIGLFMAAFPIVQIDPTFEWLRPGLGELRIMGILQRIALCYLAASVLFLYARPRIRTYWMGGILLAYWGALTLVPVPGHGAGCWTSRRRRFLRMWTVSSWAPSTSEPAPKRCGTRRGC